MSLPKPPTMPEAKPQENGSLGISMTLWTHLSPLADDATIGIESPHTRADIYSSSPRPWKDGLASTGESKHVTPNATSATA